VELAAMEFGGASVVASWAWHEIQSDSQAWCASVDELATLDACARDQTTRYELRHVIGEAVKGVTHLRRAVVVTGDQNTALDGSMTSLLAQSQRAAERAHTQLIEMSRQMAEGHKATLEVVKTQSELIRALQVHTVEQTTEMLEAAGAPSNGKDEAFGKMVETFAPMLIAQMTQPKGD
jgi:hypothetical protein